MTLENVPWMVDGGRHTAAIGRMLAYQSTGGAEGVSGSGDLKVAPTAVPSGNIKIAGGGATLLNRYPNNPNQSYMARNVGDDTSVAITATGGSARYDIVALVIDDPEFGGSAVADPLVGPYAKWEVVTNVPAGTKRWSDLGRSYPGYALARIAMPASTGTVTAAMITDLRKLAQPRSRREQLMLFPGSTKAMSKTAYGTWPLNTTVSVEVPTWATKLNVVASIDGIKANGGTANLEATGGVRTVYNGTASQNGIVVPTQAGGRLGVNVLGQFDVAAAERGTARTIDIQGYQTAGDGSIIVDNQSTALVTYEFLEDVV